MPERGDDLEARVSRLEGEVARLKDGVSVSRADAAAARVLAGGADREVSDVRTELRAHTQVLNALRETQLEQGRHLSQLDGKVDRLDTKVVRLDTKVVRLDAKVDQMDAKVDQALGLLSTGMAQIVALLSDPRDKGQGRG
jgi:outer membrane murein-binding lipoprotein Lpp